VTDDRDPVDALIAAQSALLGIPVGRDWVPAVRQSLDVAFIMARRVESVTLPDEAEPAPVFDAFDSDDRS